MVRPTIFSIWLLASCGGANILLSNPVITV